MSPLKTTVIGSFPKPEYLGIPCWVKNGKEVINFVEEYNKALSSQGAEDIENQLQAATQDIIALQRRVGLDLLTDGELRREKYIHTFCRSLNGFDFQKTKKKICRNGAWEGLLPTIVSKVSHKEEPGFMAKEWKWSQNMSERPIKVTIPGPMTIMDTFCDDFYNNDEELLNDLAKCINIELKLLAEAGCKEIQVDEPVLMRYPMQGLEYGIKYLSACITDVPKEVFKTVHACCGYPQYLDQTDYEKADKGAYLKLAPSLDNSGFDALSIEDTHRRNDPELFKAFKKMKIVLGVIDVVKSRLETVEEIRKHISDVLEYLPRERLIIAPDCGLIFLPINLVENKLANMVKAASSF
ncbi:5-methyltetrahydropteroyltriglutamate--homocysteine methyltransferase-like [Rhopilema esculentum]|uniref:5-methyltetrahydropteroyltriglutamate-- homocysteine methyltransferase-like n=1 Tax=Rhopilema esculentum TaxID=499914 RepID=UPI0031E0FC82|eukprot:gene13416-4282_t